MNIINGTRYPTDNPELAMALDRLRREGARVRITHRPANGAPIFQTVGIIGRTTGDKTAILLYNRRSMGGYIMDGDIVSVRYANKRDGGVIWKLREDAPILPGDNGCQDCANRRAHGGQGPSHNGSSLCRSGSIASGGNRAHCTCDTCF